MMWVYRKFIETLSLLFYTCMAVHVSDLLFSAGGSSAVTSKGVLNIICAANSLKLPRLASQLNSLPNKLEGKYIWAFDPKLWSNTKLWAICCQCRCSCNLGSRRPGLVPQNWLTNLLTNTQGGVGIKHIKSLAGVAGWSCPEIVPLTAAVNAEPSSQCGFVSEFLFLWGWFLFITVLQSLTLTLLLVPSD